MRGSTMPVVLPDGDLVLACFCSRHPAVAIAAYLFLGGLGSGLAMIAPNIVAPQRGEDDQGVDIGPLIGQPASPGCCDRHCGAVASICRRSACRLVRLGQQDIAVGSYNTVFGITFGLLLVALVVARFLPGKAVAKQLQQDRREEMEALAGQPTTEEAVEVESALTVGMEA